MKHLRNFNENKSLENYFKDKIDWKLFDYIKDSTLEYSDSGHVVKLKVKTNMINYSSRATVYNNTTNVNPLTDQVGFRDLSQHTLRDLRHMNDVPMLIYYLTIRKDDKYLNIGEIRILYKKIKDKFPNISSEKIREGELIITQSIIDPYEIP